MPTRLTPEQRDRATLLANRLRTLLDVTAARRDAEPSYGDISSYLAARGISLSRGRWFYMLGAERVVDDEILLDGLSEFFEVDPAYLRGGDVLPDAVAAELDLLRAMRAAKVRTYAARMLGGVSPETLGAITRLLDGEGARDQTRAPDE